MQEQKTHRMVKDPQVSSRVLADYMAASETRKRSIVRDAKYPSIARVIQHDEAKSTISDFFSSKNRNIEDLKEKISRIRARLADSDFDRDLYDHNADYIERFAEVFSKIALPSAEISISGRSPKFDLKGVRINPEIRFRLRRTTRTNKIRIGGGMFRYAKGKALSNKVAEWQSAFMFGYLSYVNPEPGSEAELKLCVTVDAYTGQHHPAPGDAVSRWGRIESACATLSEWWPAIKPPPGAVL